MKAERGLGLFSCTKIHRWTVPKTAYPEEDVSMGLREMSEMVAKAQVQLPAATLPRIHRRTPMDGVRKAEGGGEGATGEIAWVPFGVGRSADGLHRRTGAPMAVCGSCDARDGERIRSRGLSRPGWHESAGIFGCPVGGSVADGAVRPGVEWLAAGPRRG